MAVTLHHHAVRVQPRPRREGSSRARDLRRLCLVGGKHPSGSEWAAECPLRRAGQRSERARKAARARWGRAADTPEHPAEAEQGPDAPGQLGDPQPASVGLAGVSTAEAST
jgi:hypothetical protein